MLLLFDLDDTLYSRTEQLSDEYTEDDLAKITLFPGAKRLLEQKEMTKVLVTKGEEKLQQQKIKILDIKPHFQRILVCPRDEDKKECFERAMVEFPDSEVWVIGNRLDSEIRHGKELGLRTIYLRHGKYSQHVPRDADEVPDYEVENFADIARILKVKK